MKNWYSICLEYVIKMHSLKCVSSHHTSWRPGLALPFLLHLPVSPPCTPHSSRIELLALRPARDVSSSLGTWCSFWMASRDFILLCLGRLDVLCSLWHVSPGSLSLSSSSASLFRLSPWPHDTTSGLRSHPCPMTFLYTHYFSAVR